MNEQSIRSPQNPRVKNLVRLRNGHHRRRQDLFLIEGCRELKRALEAKITISELYFAPEYFTSDENRDILDRFKSEGIDTCRLSKEAFAKCAYRQGPDGLLAVAPQWTHTLEDIRTPAKPLLLVIESVEKPGNLGAILRTADAAGVDAIILTDTVTDIFNPNVIRASQGALFAQTVIVTENDATRDWLSKKGIPCFATTPSTGRDYWQADLTGPVAIIIGSENKGLSKFWIDSQNFATQLKIPLHGCSDSLNVASAAAIILFEIRRQRSTS